MKKGIRVFLPQIILCILLVILSIVFLPKSIIIPKLDVLIGAMVTVAATLSGFTLTIISIILGLSSRPLIKYLEINGGMKELRLRYSVSLVFGMLVIISNLAVGIMCDSSNTMDRWLVTVCAIITVLYFWNFITSSVYLLSTVATTSSDQIEVSTKPRKPKGKLRTD